MDKTCRHQATSSWRKYGSREKERTIQIGWRTGPQSGFLQRMFVKRMPLKETVRLHLSRTAQLSRQPLRTQAVRQCPEGRRHLLTRDSCYTPTWNRLKVIDTSASQKAPKPQRQRPGVELRQKISGSYAPTCQFTRAVR